ncbi:MAG TPA: cobalamin-dependent protein [Anaerolineae bacterium]|nr:cobalamin-dependent protein [Anaerolineae bacterium]HOR00536.1 cobalamin-dependent protein [Anaerolineae bacterium]HPL29936.1 cobalamin-dependent protein [Anaerolineae bacterium]
MQPTDANLIDAALEHWPQRVRPYQRGNVLYWQGDPVENLFVIQEGAVKVSSVSSAGKICSHGILGAGRLLGATDYFLDGIHEATAEVIDRALLIAIPPSDFQGLIARDPGFSAAVMRQLAREARVHFSRAQELSFLDAQQRLKQRLIQLADEHGLKTDEGIEIGVSITHKDIGELINANRTTITLCLQELKKLGYIRTQGRRIILIPIGHMNILDQLCEAVVSGGIGEAADWANRAIAEGIDPVTTLNSLLAGMKEVDRRFAQGLMDVNDIMWSSMHMKEALPIVEAAVRHRDISLSHIGRVVFGTVHGDIHDIGKTMVTMLLRARGFEVIDLGVDVSAGRFVEAVEVYRPHILAMSALLTTTQLQMKSVVEALEGAGLRDRVRVMIGGTSTTPRFAREIGADGYAHDARGGVELAWRWCSNPKVGEPGAGSGP